MRRFMALLCGAALTILVPACAPSLEEETADGDSALGRAGADQLPTTEPGIALLDGYTTLFDLRRSQCAFETRSNAPLVGQLEQRTTLRLVENETELATELGIDATLSVKAPTASGSASASLVRNFKSSSSNVSYLIKSVQSYVVTQGGSVTLGDNALGWLRTNPAEFLHRCGDRFVGSVTFEARVYALLTFETKSEDRAIALEGEIAAGASVAGGAVEVDGSLKAKLSRASSRSDVQTSMQIVAQGFEPPENDALGSITGTIEQKLERIESVGSTISASLRADRERDAKDYRGNNTRNAIPAAVTLLRYGIADNAPLAIDSSPAFKKHYLALQKTEAFLRAFGRLELSMERAYKNEIDPFQQAGPNEQAEYNLAPPAAPKRFAAELGPIAAQWASRFRPDDGAETGSDIQAVREAIAACVDGAKNGSFVDCHTGEDPTSLPEWKTGRAAIDEYLRSGRTVKLRFYVIAPGSTRTYRVAKSGCHDMDGWVNRLPTADEARLMAPVIAGYGGGEEKKIWVADTPDCKYDDGLLSSSGQAFFSNPIDGGGSSVGCKWYSVTDPGSEATICVGQRGPLGKLIDL